MLKNLSNTQIFLIFLGTAIVGVILGQILPPFKTWFAKSEPEEKPDCKTADGRDGKKDASGNCVAISERQVFKQCINGMEYISACPTCPSKSTGKTCTAE